jgi:hypothetical protein
MSSPEQMLIEKLLLKITTKSQITNVQPEQLLIVYLAEVCLSSPTCSNTFVGSSPFSVTFLVLHK